MNYREVYAKLCEYAPIELSDKLVDLDNGYDNSGIIVGNTGDIKKILFCLDLTGESVKAAIEKDVNLIVTHHPAIYRPIKSISENSALYACVKNNIAVISMHLNLDCAETGVDYCLAEGLGGKITEILTPLGENVGYGRLSETDATAEEIFERYKTVFGTDKGSLYGDKTEKIRLIASFCGAGLGEAEVEEALKRNADMVVSADIPHHVLLKAIDGGLSVINCTHYASENLGMKRFADYARRALENKEIYFFCDGRFA